MAKFAAATYEKTAPAEKPNPFIEVVKQFTDMGVDSAFSVEFDRDKYQAEKVQIQKAANVHGFSVREVETNAKDEGDGPITSTFLVRPRRKAKADAEAQADAE